MPRIVSKFVVSTSSIWVFSMAAFISGMSSQTHRIVSRISMPLSCFSAPEPVCNGHLKHIGSIFEPAGECNFIGGCCDVAIFFSLGSFCSFVNRFRKTKFQKNYVEIKLKNTLASHLEINYQRISRHRNKNENIFFSDRIQTMSIDS